MSSSTSPARVGVGFFCCVGAGFFFLFEVVVVVVVVGVVVFVPLRFSFCAFGV